MAGSDTPSTQAVETRTNKLVGWLDLREGVVVHGWAFNISNGQDQPLVLDVLLDGRLVDRITANQHRDDLADYGSGDCGFYWIIPEPFTDGVARRVAVRVSNGSNILPGALTQIEVWHHTLSPATGGLFLRRRDALAKASGWPMPAPQWDPTRTLEATFHAKDFALKRFAGLPPSSIAPPNFPSAFTGGVHLSPDDLGILFGTEEPPAKAFEPVTAKLEWRESGVVIGSIAGFAKSPMVDILVDGRVIDTVAALPYSAIEGAAWFGWILPREYWDGDRHDISIRLSNTVTLLPARLNDIQVIPQKLDADVEAIRVRRQLGFEQLRIIDQCLFGERAGLREPATLSLLDLAPVSVEVPENDWENSDLGPMPRVGDGGIC